MGTFWVRWDAEGDTPPLDMGRGDGHPNYYCLHSYLFFAIKSFTKPRARRAGAAVAVSYGRRLLRECREHAPAPAPAVPWHFRLKGFTASL